MEQRSAESRERGEEVKRIQTWMPYDRVSRNLVRAVLAGEDSRFFDHSGFDWEEINKALEEDWKEGRFRRGASTITQQLAKNLFLSTSRNPLRKLHEALITKEMEWILGKRRILEIYLNVIEWGDGIYGAEAASRNYFNASAAAVSAAGLQLRRFRLVLGDTFLESDLESRVSSAGMVSILCGCWPSTGYACLKLAAPGARAVRAGG